ncbi:MAG: hypothetical protein ACQKBY_07455 [Verrucomicrobiales bacterium]
MKAIVLISSVSLAAWLQAGPPEVRPVTAYYHLWQESPFTEKLIEVEEEVVEENEMENYALLGVEVTPHGKLVVLQHVENEGERVTVRTWDGSSGFRILEVKQDMSESLKTRVLLEKGGKQGWVSYDPKYLTLKSAPAPVVEKKEEENGKKPEEKKEAAQPRVRFRRTN